MSYEPTKIDILWFIYIGCCLLGFPEDQVMKMSIKKINTLYEFYKDDYDFKLTKITYRSIKEKRKKALDGELIPDQEELNGKDQMSQLWDDFNLCR